MKWNVCVVSVFTDECQRTSSQMICVNCTNNDFKIVEKDLHCTRQLLWFIYRSNESFTLFLFLFTLSNFEISTEQKVFWIHPKKAYKCLVKSWHMFCIFKMDTQKSEHRLLWNCGIWFAYIRVKYNQKFIPLIWCSRAQSAIYLIWYACVRFTFFLIFIFYWREEKKIRLVSWFSLYCLDLIVRC